jgi:hypothetical protein
MAVEKDVLSVRENFVPPGHRIRSRKVFVATSTKKRDENLITLLCSWLVEHQIGKFTPCENSSPQEPQVKVLPLLTKC